MCGTDRIATSSTDMDHDTASILRKSENTQDSIAGSINLYALLLSIALS